MKKFNLILILLLTQSIIFAQIPNGYYDGTEGLDGDDLREELRGIITSGHTQNSYDDLYYDYQDTDNYSNGKVWDMYSINASGGANYWYTHIVDKCSSGYDSEGDCYNREHSIPASWFNDNYPMYADLFMVIPSDGYVNNRRSNHPYGEVGSASWTSSNGSRVGSCSYSGYSGTVFEPIDEYKGDFARAYFYVATRYKNSISSWNGASFSGNNLSDWSINMFLEWHQNDPVSQKEIDRNNAVHDAQHNRNPYIDYPEWAECVWDECSDLRFTSTPVTTAAVGYNYTYNITYLTNENQEIITCEQKPSWLTFSKDESNNTALLTGTPQATGNYDVVLRLVENSDVATQEFTIVVSETPEPSLIFNKDFDDNSLTSGGWSSYSVSGEQEWEVRDYYHSSPYGGYMCGYQSPNTYENEDWLISPAYNAENYDNEVLSFWSAYNYPGPNPEIFYSSNYSGSGNPEDADWTKITGYHLPPGENWDFEYSNEIDLSLITGSSVYFGFVFYSTSSESSTWEIDDILLEGINLYSIKDNSFSDINFKIFPNPTKSEINLEYSLITQTNIDISILDITGKKIKILETGKKISGNYKKNFQIDLQSGIYLLSFKTDYFNTTKKIVVK